MNYEDANDQQECISEIYKKLVNVSVSLCHAIEPISPLSNRGLSLNVMVNKVSIFTKLCHVKLCAISPLGVSVVLIKSLFVFIISWNFKKIFIVWHEMERF